MVDFNNKKINYTTGNEFTLNDADYVGYITTLSGTAYAGKNTFTQVVSAKNNYLADVAISTFLYDRVLDDKIVLPYNIENLTVPNGEFITADNLGEYFSKFYTNNTYLFSRLFLNDTDIPKNVSSVICVTGVDSNLQRVTSNLSVSAVEFEENNVLAKYEFNSVKSILYKENPTNNNFVIIGLTDTSLVSLTGNTLSNTVGISLSSSFITYQPNDLMFKNIVDGCIIGDFLFVLDEGNNSLIKYNIFNFYSGDQSNISPKILIEIKSGGGRYQPSTFNNPNLLASSDDTVYIYQQSDRFFKSYDVNLNLRNSRKVFRRVNEMVLGIGYNKFFNYVAAIVQVNNIFSFYYLDDEFNVLEKYNFNFRLSDGESIKKIFFSENNSNIFYVLTDKFCYKYMVNRPENYIGSFSNTNLKIINSDTPYRGMYLAGSSENYDRLLILKGNRFITVDEPSSYVTALKSTTFLNYSTNDIDLNKFEYFQANYINKELYKIFENIIRIKNEIVGSFYAEYILTDNQLTYEDTLYNPTQALKGLNYFLNYDFLNIDNQNDFFLHENETINNTALNRCFSNLYKLQLSIANSCNVVNTSLVPYLSADNSLYIS